MLLPVSIRFHRHQIKKPFRVIKKHLTCQLTHRSNNTNTNTHTRTHTQILLGKMIFPLAASSLLCLLFNGHFHRTLALRESGIGIRGSGIVNRQRVLVAARIVTCDLRLLVCGDRQTSRSVRLRCMLSHKVSASKAQALRAASPGGRPRTPGPLRTKAKNALPTIEIRQLTIEPRTFNCPSVLRLYDRKQGNIHKHGLKGCRFSLRWGWSHAHTISCVGLIKAIGQ